MTDANSENRKSAQRETVRYRNRTQRKRVTRPKEQTLISLTQNESHSKICQMKVQTHVYFLKKYISLYKTLTTLIQLIIKKKYSGKKIPYILPGAKNFHNKILQK